MVARIVAARDRLIAARDEGRFGVTINGVLQDGEMVEQARPAIVATLERRIEELDADLKQLGVEVG
ncbi:MAG: hypothetical protein M3N07_10055 [Pseudomonadota bacterium]|nr:hypothetical protein [Pseudomonadota bacterium]